MSLNELVVFSEQLILSSIFNSAKNLEILIEELKAVKAYESSPDGQIALGWLHFALQKTQGQSKDYFKAASNLAGKNRPVLNKCARVHELFGGYYGNHKAPPALLKEVAGICIEACTDIDRVHVLAVAKYSKQADLIKDETIVYNNKNNSLFLLRQMLAEVMEKDNLIPEVENSNGTFLNPLTAYNVKKVVKFANEHGIRMYLMQYPLLPIKSLSDIPMDGLQVNYISNERNFNEALKKRNFKYLFSDNFAGQFGHPTLFGNELIVDNIMQALQEAKDLDDN